LKANGNGDGMDEDGESLKIKYRERKYLLLKFTPSSPLTLPSLHPCSHASCLPQLVVMLPLVLCHLPSGGASICPPLVAPPHLVVPLFFSGALTVHLPRLFLVSSLVTLPPPIRLCLRLSSHRCLLLCPSCIFCLAGSRVASHYVDASCPPAPQTLVVPWPLVAPLSCLLSTLAGCCVARDAVQYGAVTSRHPNGLQAKMEHPIIRELGGPAVGPFAQARDTEQ
jgi:hypothetical protein